MRLQQYLKEENVIQKALDIEEPDVGGEYDNAEISDMLELINIAIGKQSEKISKLRKSGSDEELDTARSILKDLKDKEEKLENHEKETKPAGPNPEPAAGEEGPPPPDEGEEPPPDEQDQEEPPPEEDEKKPKKGK